MIFDSENQNISNNIRIPSEEDLFIKRQRTLVIGLGGTGREVVTRVKEMMKKMRTYQFNIV